MNKHEEKICPIMMLLTAVVNPAVDTIEDVQNLIKCKRDKCAWWQVYYQGTEKEYAECVINSLSCLQDML